MGRNSYYAIRRLTVRSVRGQARCEGRQLTIRRHQPSLNLSITTPTKELVVDCIGLRFALSARERPELQDLYSSWERCAAEGSLSREACMEMHYACGVWYVICGVRCAVCGCAVCGVQCAVCGVRCAECGMRCVECGMYNAMYTIVYECGWKRAA